MKDMVLVLDNIRSAHNVGSIMRTAAGLGVWQIYVLGRTPYPKIRSDQSDARLPHIAERADRQILKTSLGAEAVVNVTPIKDVPALVDELKGQGFELIAIENTDDAEPLPDFKAPYDKTALVLGHEIEGVSQEILEVSDRILAIPMTEHKESLNVAAAAAIAMYHFKFKA